KFWGDDEDKSSTKSSKKEDKSLIESLKFWGTDDKKQASLDNQYRVKVVDSDNGNSEVTVVNTEGKRVTTTTANRIIALMYEQLR
ncbi:MAG: hypothetical protein VW395_05130, partial [Methylotenera sp.]